jgi:predicted outer membrane protein
MLHRIPRSVRWALLVAVLGAVTVSVLQSWTSGAPGTGGWQQTQWGPLGPADRDLLIKVRQAGLWELPTGQQMAQQASNQQVRETGQHLAEQHAVLDKIDRDTADKLGVQLPSRATDQQIGWMNQISQTTGTDYDKVAVQLLRQAHGIVLPVIAEVRVGSRNELVRQFADTAFQYVTGHIAMLEATGLVDYSALPESPSPGLLSGATTPADMIVPAIVFLACAGAAIGLLVTLRRGKKKPPAAAAPATGSQLAALHSAPVLTIPAPREESSGRRGKRVPLPVGGAAQPSGATSTGGHRARRRGSQGGSHSGGYRVDDSGGFRVDDSGGFRVDDSGGFRRADTGGHRLTRSAGTSGDTSGHRVRNAADSGGFPAARTATAVSDSGGYPSVSDTGSHRRRRAGDSGGFRFDDLLGSDRTGTTGGHRVPRTTDTGGHRLDEHDPAARSPRSATRGLTR